MKYLIILMLCMLATSKVMLQSFFSKKSVKNLTDAVAFNGTVFTVAAILFCYQIPGCSMQSLIFGAIFGILTVVFQLSYTKALSGGNVSLTVMIVNLSMIIPITISVIVYHEGITVYKIIGFAFTCLTFFLGLDLSETPKIKRWLFPAICAFASSGGINTVQKVFGKTEYIDEKMAFVSFSYVVAAIATLIIYLIVRKKQKITFAFDKKFFMISASIGSILAVFQVFNTYAISVIDGTFFFPAYSGISIICSSVCGIVFFKDKLNRKQKLSLALGALAIVLMNF